MAPASPSPATPAIAAATVPPRPLLATPWPDAERLAAVPALATREAAWQAALAGDAPILPLPGELDEDRRRAQEVALANAEVEANARDEGGAPYRAEVMQVRPMLPADLSARTAACRDARCMRVEIYVHGSNTALVVTVDLASGQVVDLLRQPGFQPEVPSHLAELAAQLASRSPQVIAELGFAPGSDQAGMPNVKTALNGSRCERSGHLCVAPTFLQGERALWAIVDLTAGQIVGTRWTSLGKMGAPAVTEQGLQDEVVMTQYCEQVRPLERDGWSLEYVLTPSDGLEVKDVRFHGNPVLRSAKLVDWHVSYSGTDGFGYSDATGCPKFSTASVVAFNGPTTEDLRDERGEVVGFALVQDFRSEIWPAPCNYRYVQRYELYRDGRLRVGGANLGRGCGNNGTYRPVLRMVLPTGASGGVAEWDGRAWQPWDEEGWRLQGAETSYTPAGYQLQLTDADGRSYYLEPDRGQLAPGGRGDNAYLYLTRHKPAEGDGDLLTIGACCNADHQQGPEKYQQPPEPLVGSDVTLWYVPQMENSATPGAEYCWAETLLEAGRSVVRTFPCTFGPLFVPGTAAAERGG